MTSGLTMNARQPTPVDDLVAGMILAENVNDSQGRLLIPGGTELTDRHLRAFALWGVMAVRVRGAGGEEEAEPEVSPEAVAAARELVLPRFVHNDLQHPLIAVLLEQCIHREARRIAGGGHA